MGRFRLRIDHRRADAITGTVRRPVAAIHCMPARRLPRGAALQAALDVAIDAVSCLLAAASCDTNPAFLFFLNGANGRGSARVLVTFG